MYRGEIWIVRPDKQQGGEIKKVRPAVIVSNNAANKYLNRVQIVPITSNARKLYPSEAYVRLRKQVCKAVTDQITTVSKKKLLRRVGALKAQELRNIDQALMLQLGLS